MAKLSIPANPPCQKIEQACNLDFRAIPVFGGESIKSEVFYTIIGENSGN
jgi:hypothetical protein